MSCLFCQPQSYGLRLTSKLVICMCVFSDQSVIGWTQFCYLILSASEASYWSHKITVLCTVVILAPLLATYSSVTVQIYPSKNESTHTGRQDSPQMKILAVHKSYCSLLPCPGYWCSVSDFKKLDKFIFRQLCCDIKLAQPWVWRSRSWLCSLSPPTTPGKINSGKFRSLKPVKFSTECKCD